MIARSTQSAADRVETAPEPRAAAFKPRLVESTADGAPSSRSSARASSAKASASRQKARPWRIIAVGGGKGGIGKSLIAANLGVTLARTGKRVVVIDADLGGANLHTCLGIAPPKQCLSDFLDRKVARIQDLVVPTGVENLSLVSGAVDSLEAANLKYSQKLKLLRNFQALDVDYAILDLGAGSSFNVLDFFVIANHGILVLVPEPTSVENAYRFLKAAFFRRMSALETDYGVESLVREALAARGAEAIRTPHDLIAAVRRRDPQIAERFEAEVASFRPRLVVNQARTPEDYRIGDAVAAAWRKYFGLEMDYLGAIGYDDEVWRSVRKRRPVTLEQPEAATAQAIVRIGEKLLEIDRATRAPVAIEHT